MAACGKRWHVAHPLFSVINGGEEVDAPATQAQITSHNKTLKLIGKKKWEEKEAGESKR